MAIIHMGISYRSAGRAWIGAGLGLLAAAPLAVVAPMSAYADTSTCAGAFAVAAGGIHSLAVVGSGGAGYAWGDNYIGQLGDGTTTTRSTAGEVVDGAGVPLAGVTSVAAGDYHSLAVGAGGVVYAWGSNFYGELGDGTGVSRSTPGRVLGPGGVPLVGVAAVAAGRSHSLALGAGGVVYAWGDNSSGQLGDGTTISRSTAVRVLGPGGVPLAGITAVAAGGSHSLALGGGGVVYAWGDNFAGQLGDGTGVSRSTAGRVLGPGGVSLAGVTAIAAGTVHSLAVGAGGVVYAWGENRFGQLGDGTTTRRFTPVEVLGLAGAPLSGITAVAGGSNHSLAVGFLGVVYAWGYNGSYQLGDGTSTTRHTAGLVLGPGGAPLVGARAVAAGDAHSLAVGPLGVVYAWGANGYGQLGDGTTNYRSRAVTVVGCPLSPLTLLGTPGGGGLPSSRCDGGLPVFEGTTEGVYTKLYLWQPSAQEVHICARIEGAGTGKGGQLVLTPTAPTASVGGIGQPSIGTPTLDGNGGACGAATDNLFPGTHPIAKGNVAGVTYSIDAYLGSSATWLCIQAATSVNQRVIVPLTAPSVGTPMVTVTPGTQVQFFPDPGTP